MGEAMQWAHHCRREWQEAVQSREEAKRQRYFEAQRIRRHTGKIYDVVERIGHRSGIERVSLTRREKIEANNLALSKGLQPKYVTL